MSTIIGYTTNYGLAKIDFNAATWHTEMNANLDLIDTVIKSVFGALSINRGAWANSTAYIVTDRVIDSTTSIIYSCNVLHTSAASPTTFAADRVAHPTYWSIINAPPATMGTWLTATAYPANTYVVNGYQYALCLVAHTSGGFATDLAAGKWLVVIDFTAFVAAMNALVALVNPFKFLHYTFANTGGTSVINTGEYVDTTGGATTRKLPLVPADGDTLRYIDNRCTWNTNNLTIDGNGKNINFEQLGAAATLTCDAAGCEISLTYDSTLGYWVGVGHA